MSQMRRCLGCRLKESLTENDPARRKVRVSQSWLGWYAYTELHIIRCLISWVAGICWPYFLRWRWAPHGASLIHWKRGEKLWSFVVTLLDFSGSKCFRAHAPGCQREYFSAKCHIQAESFRPTRCLQDSVPSLSASKEQAWQGFQCQQSADFDNLHRLPFVLFGQAHQMKQALHKVGLNNRGLPMQVCKSSQSGPTSSVLPLAEKGRDTARGVGICVGPKDWWPGCWVCPHDLMIWTLQFCHWD